MSASQRSHPVPRRGGALRGLRSCGVGPGWGYAHACPRRAALRRCRARGVADGCPSRPTPVALRNGGRPLALAVVFGGAIGPALLVAGLERIPAATASLLLNFEPLATVALAAFVFCEHLGRRLLVAAGLIASLGRCSYGNRAQGKVSASCSSSTCASPGASTTASPPVSISSAPSRSPRALSSDPPTSPRNRRRHRPAGRDRPDRRCAIDRRPRLRRADHPGQRRA